ncbi:heparin lyase I family protein [Myxococcus xanthus]|uniref:heparin lyase I family protein n=1 Tax=Myxococcus xanthus TaxID=34 RepID=UPI00112DC43F|nr:heparin lyase I family protein [Myxococcus xanthus]QDE80919.1 carbohydrate-binding protein [Myxococcus xanthus]
MTQLLRLAALVSLIPSFASADVVWKGDFETGNTSQWTRSQSVSNSRLQVVTDVVREGRYALKATVRQGDDPINASGNRNELLYISQEKADSTWYYKWSTLFPTNYPLDDSWQVFAQWHQEGCCGSPPLEFYVRGEEMHMRVGGVKGKVLWTAPLKRGDWSDFVLQVKWSPNAKTGFVQLWHNNEVVVPKTYVATQFGKEMNYLKLGLYRDDAIRPEASVYHDGFTMASTLEEVMPPTPEPAPAPPAPVPEPTIPAPEQPGEDAPSEELPDGPIVRTPDTQPQTRWGVTTPEDILSGESPLGSDGARGCNASGGGTAGVPITAAVGLLSFAALFARRRKPAQARAHAKR